MVVVRLAVFNVDLVWRLSVCDARDVEGDAHRVGSKQGQIAPRPSSIVGTPSTVDKNIPMDDTVMVPRRSIISSISFMKISCSLTDYYSVLSTRQQRKSLRFQAISYRL